jgi:hypothetical protein
MAADRNYVDVTLPSGSLIRLVSDREGDGPTDVAFGKTLDLADVFETVQEFAQVATDSLRKLRPDEIEIEFSVGVTASSGKLTALIVEGGGEASLSCRLMWKRNVDEKESQA